MNIESLVAYATIGAFLVTLISIAFSSKKYLEIKKNEQKSERFTTYHGLIRAISLGEDNAGRIKLVSQLAYIYELRNFPEYACLTENTLHLLREQWAEVEKPEKLKILKDAVDETLPHLQKG